MISRFRPKIGYRQWLANRLMRRQVVRPEQIVSGAEFSVDYFGLRYRGNTSNLIDAHVMYYGAYEKPQLFFLRDLLAALDSGQKTFWDVGANSGLYSGFASGIVHTVHAFEPYPPMVERLNRLITENALSNISTHPVGLGEAASSRDYFPPGDSNQGAGSFVSGWEGRAVNPIDLRIERADDYMEMQPGPSAVKIDVEGFTKPVLRGMRSTLEQHRPSVLLEANVGSAAYGFAAPSDLAALFPERYEFYKFSYENRFTGDYELTKLGQSFGGTEDPNVVAIPSEDASKVPLARNA